METNIKTNIDSIKLLAKKIKEKFNPQKILLFGSYAYGKPKKDSDIDLLIVMSTNLKPYKQASLIRLHIDQTYGVRYPIDIIVRTPEEIRERVQEGDFFIKKILQEGVLL
ncbi:MAG: nucleotidyltransferase domain-containing protein [bacterium]